MMTLTFANKITICRIIAVPFFIAMVLYYPTYGDQFRFIALGIFLFAVISDAIDGYIARTRNQKTRAGAILDPLADKLLLVSAFICLYKVGVHFPVIRFPMWLVVAIISRDLILIIGSMVLQSIIGKVDVRPSIFGKATSFFQILCVIGMLLQIPMTWYWYVALAFTIVSGLDYIKEGIKALNASSH